AGALFSLAFTIVLVPWTIRNARVFHLFQPLAPAHGEMPGEFVPRGYYLWLRSWLDDSRFVPPMLWSLDTDPIDIDELPPSAFDSADERSRVAALLDKYNHPGGSQPAKSATPQSNPAPQASLTQTPASSPQPTKPATVLPQQNSKAGSNANADDEDE